MKQVGCKFSGTSFIPQAVDCQISESGDAIVVIMGDVFDLNHHILSPDSVLSLFVLLKDQICSSITGNYSIIAFDKRTETVFAFQNAIGSSVYLYYREVDGCVYICSSLYSLIRQSCSPAEIDENVVLHFLLNGFVVGSSTLLKGVKKLIPGCILQVNANGVLQKPCKYSQLSMMAGDAASAWDDILADILGECYKKSANIALSSGFDSNYILYNGVRIGVDSINAYSIGGNFDGNELPSVKKIASLYPSVHLKCSNTDRNTFLQLPDIVHRLEGQVYERGVFLQYELAKLVAQDDSSTLICGECANEVMSLGFSVNQDVNIQPQAINAYKLDPYCVASYVIVKKSGILLNSFGVDSMYPFADQGVINLAHSLRYNNCTSKSFHVDDCKRLFTDEHFSLLGNRAGATKESSFLDEANLGLLNSLMRENPYFIKYGNLLFEAYYSEPASVQRTPNYNTNIRNPFKLRKCEIMARKSEFAQFLKNRADAELKVKLICLYLDLFRKSLCDGVQGGMIADYYKV